jgi:AP2 domain
MKPLRNIRRMDDDSRRTHAWLVQVQRKGHIIIKMFSDGLFGGKQKALSAALEYRDALSISPSPAEHNLWHRTIIRRNNTSGIPGVGLYKRPNGSERWVAYWTDEYGIKKSRTFTVKSYGKKAKQLAVAERQRQLKRIFEIKSSNPPT